VSRNAIALGRLKREFKERAGASCTCPLFVKRPVSPTDKPDSVGIKPGNHFSQDSIARVFQQPTRSVFVGLSDPHCLFGLASAGAYQADSVTTIAGSSYLTISPLPVFHVEGTIGGVFSVALSVTPKCAQELPGSLLKMSGLSSGNSRDCLVGDIVEDRIFARPGKEDHASVC
jgi:hypothetical protein